MVRADDLTVDVQESGVFIRFAARNGAAVSLKVEDLAAQSDGATREVLLSWCQGRRAGMQSPQSLGEQASPLLVQDYAD